MPWSTPTLATVRGLVRDSVRSLLPGSDATPVNSVLRVLSDVMGALCHLTLQYVDWLALQLLPDTAETEWLDRHGQIWLVNADGTVGRKNATYATGTVLLTGELGAPIPSGSILNSTTGIQYQTTDQEFMGSGPTAVPVMALTAGADGNLLPESPVVFVTPPANIDTIGVVITMDGGTDTETDDELRSRILQRIREPPQGGDQADYVRWALEVPGVTRAWCYPLEMGIGTVTIRFMMDDLRADQNGIPNGVDILTVSSFMDTVRPVAVKDIFVEAPIPVPIDTYINNLDLDNESTRGAIVDNIENMLLAQTAPGQTIYAVWKSWAVMNSPGVVSFDMGNNVDDVMPSPGHIGIMGSVIYDTPAVSATTPATPGT